jgi:hypothetical protein
MEHWLCLSILTMVEHHYLTLKQASVWFTPSHLFQHIWSEHHKTNFSQVINMPSTDPNLIYLYRIERNAFNRGHYDLPAMPKGKNALHLDQLFFLPLGVAGCLVYNPVITMPERPTLSFTIVIHILDYLEY